MSLYCFLPSTAFTAAVVTITTTGSAIAGEMLTLTCRVTVVEGLTVQPDVEWLDSVGSAVTSGMNDVTIGNVMINSRESTIGLKFSTLRTSHGGQYTCRATINVPLMNISDLSNSSSQDVIVQSKFTLTNCTYTCTSTSIIILYTLKFSRDNISWIGSKNWKTKSLQGYFVNRQTLANLHNHRELAVGVHVIDYCRTPNHHGSAHCIVMEASTCMATAGRPWLVRWYKDCWTKFSWFLILW